MTASMRREAAQTDLIPAAEAQIPSDRAVDRGGSRLVWHWQTGGRTEVRFRRENHHIRMTVRQQTAA